MSIKGTILFVMSAVALIVMPLLVISADKDSVSDLKIISGESAQIIQVPAEFLPTKELKQQKEINWGTSDEVMQKIHAYGFVPIDSTTTFSYIGSTAMRYRTGGSYPWFESAVHLPAGAKINHFFSYVCDTNASSDIWVFFVVCPDGSSCTWYGASISGTPGCGYLYVDLSADNIVIDNFNNSYFFEVNLQATDSSTRFQSVEVHYNLQVSPAPGTPTFSDVPASHIFYQFVEALAASGITGGCSATQFCPDAPITRGQMAKFLAVALGLHWPY